MIRHRIVAWLLPEIERQLDLADAARQVQLSMESVSCARRALRSDVIREIMADIQAQPGPPG